MDQRSFDTLAQLISVSRSRRGAFATLLGAALLRQLPTAVAAKKRHKKHRKHQKKKRRKACYTGTSCQPGVDKNNAKCNFQDSTQFFQLDVQGADLSQTNLAGAQLAGANLSGVDLSGACLVGANLLGATVDETTNLDGAVLCRTLMLDGSLNDDDCDKGTRCCPMPEACEEGECEAAGCASRYNDECSVIGFPAPFCCQPAVCTPTLISPLYTRCQVPCTSDAICQNVFGGNSHCAVDLFFCPYIGPCCSRP